MKTSLLALLVALLMPVLSPSPASAIETSVLEESAPSRRFLSLSVSAVPAGVGAALASPVLPVEAGVNLGAGLVVGPTATFSGSFGYHDATYSLAGLGGQLSWSPFGPGLQDGFFLQAFYTQYTLNASKTQTLFGMMPVPMEGSMPIRSFGGALSYQWIWKSGFRLSAGARLAHFGSDSSAITVMGQNVDSLRSTPGMQQLVDIPVLKDESQWLPMPELTLGWAF